MLTSKKGFTAVNFDDVANRVRLGSHGSLSLVNESLKCLVMLTWKRKLEIHY